MNIEHIAAVCHEANKAYCATLGDYSQPSWELAPEWQRNSAISGVKFHLANPDAPASASHDNWMREKLYDGWRYGPAKDGSAKTHPCMVEFDKLHPAQQMKDYIFRNIVHAFIQQTEGK